MNADRNPDIDKPSTSFNYSNCIVANHASLDSLDSSFASENESTLAHPLEENEEQYVLSVEIVRDSYILMVGFLNSIERYLDGNSAKKKEDLKHELALIRNALLHNNEAFGCDKIANINGNMYIPDSDDKSRKKGKQRTISKQIQVSARELLTKSDKALNHSHENASKTIKNKITLLPKKNNQPPRRRSSRIKNTLNAIKKDVLDFNNYTRTRNKREACSWDSRISKKAKYAMVHKNLSNTESKLKLAMADFHKDTAKSKAKKNNNLQNRRETCKLNKEKSKMPKKTPKKKTSLRATRSLGHLELEGAEIGISRSNLLSFPDKASSSPRVQKRRTLYSADSWLDVLSKTTI